VPPAKGQGPKAEGAKWTPAASNPEGTGVGKAGSFAAPVCAAPQVPASGAARQPAGPAGPAPAPASASSAAAPVSASAPAPALASAPASSAAAPAPAPAPASSSGSAGAPATEDRAVLLRRRGNELFKKARYKEAIIAYTDAIALKADDPLVLTNRAAAYMMEEEYWRAVSTTCESSWVRKGRACLLLLLLLLLEEFMLGQLQ
jgi:hypothetical protein